MDCKKIKEELVFLFIDNEMGQDLVISYKSHVSRCPECARHERIAACFVSLLRKRNLRCEVPSKLRGKILSGLPHRQRQDSR